MLKSQNNYYLKRSIMANLKFGTKWRFEQLEQIICFNYTYYLNFNFKQKK